MTSDVTDRISHVSTQKPRRLSVLHIYPKSAKIQELWFHGSTKSVRSVVEYLQSRPVELTIVDIERKRGEMIEGLKDFDKRKNLKKYDRIIFDIPGTYPKAIKFLRKRAPYARLIIRTHNAEFFHRVDWTLAEKTWRKKLLRLRSAVRGLLGDVVAAHIADYVLPVVDWDAKWYWKLVGHPSKIVTVPYFTPTEYLGPRPADREKTDLCVCFTSVESSPLMMDATKNFVDLVDGLQGRCDNWEFTITGSTGNMNLCRARIQTTGLLKSPFEVLDRARAVAVLSDYGRGIKTKIIEAIHARAYVLVTPGLYKRLPEELKPFCFAVPKGSVEAFAGALARCSKPYPKHDPNALLKKRFFKGFDLVLFGETA